MISAFIKEITINRSKLKQFAWIMALMLGLVIPAILLWVGDWQISMAVQVMVLAGALFLVSGLMAPMVLRIPYIMWMLLALILGSVMTRIIIAIVFYFLITPVGMVRRALGKSDPLGSKTDPSASGYWILREEEPDSGRMKKQY